MRASPTPSLMESPQPHRPLPEVARGWGMTLHVQIIISFKRLSGT